MSTLPGPGRSLRPSYDSDIYTGLLGIAVLFLLVATIYLVVRSLSLFGTVLPPGGS